MPGVRLQSLQSGTFGTIGIGAGPSWLQRHLPLAVARVISRHPGIHIRISGGFDEELFRLLRQGEFDFVVAELPQPQGQRGLEVRPLMSDTLGVCCRIGHPLMSDDPASLADLLHFPWVMMPRTTRAQQRLGALFAAQDLPLPKTVVETESPDAIAEPIKTH